ncbi:hypothetical protein HHI36_006505 [Cryptolaemus montrouzieri]|uniref:Uncharacterized protein n=1 Tax=Cryptolaemus montrouzieri TaxID=559131 RepID=A0ABD2NXD5_9CUCU
MSKIGEDIDKVLKNVDSLVSDHSASMDVASVDVSNSKESIIQLINRVSPFIDQMIRGCSSGPAPELSSSAVSNGIDLALKNTFQAPNSTNKSTSDFPQQRGIPLVESQPDLGVKNPDSPNLVNFTVIRGSGGLSSLLQAKGRLWFWIRGLARDTNINQVVDYVNK